MIDLNILDQFKTDITTLEQRALSAESALKKVESDRDYHRAEANHLRGIIKRLFNDAADVFGVDHLPDDGEAIMSDYPAEAPATPSKPARKTRKAAKAPQPVKAAPIAEDALTDDDRAILAGLTTEWQTVLQLHKSAVAHGFTMGNQTVRNRMLRHIVVTAEGAPIEQQASPLAWRLRSSPVDPKPAPKAHISSDTGLAELRAAIERATGMTMKQNFTADVVKISGHMTADERYERDKLLLETLGDDPKGKNYDEWRDAFVKAGGEETHSSVFEKQRHRLNKEYIIDRVTGLRGMGREPRYRVRDLSLNLFMLSSNRNK